MGAVGSSGSASPSGSPPGSIAPEVGVRLWLGSPTGADPVDSEATSSLTAGDPGSSTSEETSRVATSASAELLGGVSVGVGAGGPDPGPVIVGGGTGGGGTIGGLLVPSSSPGENCSRCTASRPSVVAKNSRGPASPGPGARSDGLGRSGKVRNTEGV